jgi:phosphoribosylformylglycinamidine synthase
MIGKVTSGPLYRLLYHGEVVCEAKAQDITWGLQYERPIAPRVRTLMELPRTGKRELADIFLAMLSHPNQASKAALYRHYDKNVLGNTLLEPGEADAGVIAPLQNLESTLHAGSHPGWELPAEDRWIGVAVSCSGNARYGKISPYWQGVNAVVESLRNVAAVGAIPRALTDCLNYGNPEIPEELWELAEGVRGIADAARGVTIDGEPIPVISGNVSLYNSSPEGPIPPTAIVSCIGVLPDARRAVGSHIVEPNSLLFLLGERKDECGGSAYEEILGGLGLNVPQPDFAEVHAEILFVTEAIQAGNVLSCHDISEGGVLLALFEMLTPRHRDPGPLRGMHVFLSKIPGDLPPDRLLFSETGGFVLEVAREDVAPLRALSERHGVQLFELGTTTEEPLLLLEDLCSFSLPELLPRWREPLARLLGL